MNEAVFIKTVKEMKDLLQEDPDKRNVAWRNWSTMHYCAECGCAQAARLLLDASASVDLEAT